MNKIQFQQDEIYSKSKIKLFFSSIELLLFVILINKFVNLLYIEFGVKQIIFAIKYLIISALGRYLKRNR